MCVCTFVWKRERVKRDNEKFLHPTSLSAYTIPQNRPNQTKLAKSQEKLIPVFPGGLPGPQKGDRKGRPGNYVFVLWGLL